MTWFRWLIAALAALVAAAWAVPSVLDWNRYRADIAGLASEVLRRDVRIDGAVALVLLPEPVLTASNVTIDGGGVAVAARELRLRVGLWSLVAGRVDARELVLRGVDVRAPWPLPADVFAARSPSWLSGVSARVEDARLAIGGVVVTGIAATLTTADDTGSYLAAGIGQVSGRGWHFTARLSQPGRDGSAGLDVTLDGQGPVQGVGAVLSGQLTADGGFAGRLTARGPDLSQLLPGPATAFRADGRVSAADGLLAAPDLAVELGGSPGRGAVSLRLSPVPRLDLAFAAGRLDLDAWVAAILRGVAAPWLRDLSVGVDLSAEAAPLAGGTVRGIRGAFDLADGVVNVRELSAALPGDTALTLAGKMSVAGGKPARFDGRVGLSAPALRATLAWLQGAGLTVPLVLPDGVLRTLTVDGHVLAEPGQIAIDGATGTIDEAGFAGDLTWRAGPRPKITSVLALSRLELDPWLRAAPRSLNDIQAGFDADLRLEAKQAIYRGAVMAPMLLDALAEPTRITLRKFETTIEGVHAVASGVLLEGGRLTDGRLELQTPRATVLANVVAARLPDEAASWLRRAAAVTSQPASIVLLAAGPPAAMAIRIAAEVGDLRLEAHPTVDFQAAKWSGPATLRHPGAPRLLDAIGLHGAAAWLGDGSLALIGQFAVAGGRFALDSFELTAGALHAGGTLALQRSETGSNITGRINAETLPMPLPALRAREPLPLGPLAGWQVSIKLTAGRLLLGALPPIETASGTLVIGDGIASLEALTGRLSGGTLTGAISVDTRSQPPVLTMDGQLAGAVLSGPLFDLPFDLNAGVLDAGVALTATGYAPAGLLATLAGTIRLGVRDGVLAGVDLAAIGTDAVSDAALRTGLLGGSSAFERLQITARAGQGGLTMEQGTVVGPAGSIGLTGRVDILGAGADLRLALRPAVEDPPEIGLRLTGPFDALRRTPEIADVVRWRAEHVLQR